MAYEVTEYDLLLYECGEAPQILIDISFENLVLIDQPSTEEEQAKSFQTHSKDKSFKCNICTKSYKSKGTITRHMNVHKGIHKCEKCNKCLASKSALKTHLNIHSNEKPFKCDICNFAFKYSNNLVAHMNLHKGIFKCEKCNKNFNSKNNLERHVHEKHVNITAYKCNICNSTFKYLIRLTQHMAEHKNL